MLPCGRRSRFQAVLCVWRLGGVVLALALFCGDAGRAQAQETPAAEYQVKAAFLVNFASFVEWPADPTLRGKDPITICVYRTDPFGGFLDDLIRKKALKAQELQARRVSDPAGLKACQIVFISDREDTALPEVINGLKGRNALLVGESKDFAQRGGGIQFFLEDNRLRFAINVDATERAGLKMSSKLLALAKVVHDK
jgi:hypothetical protein